MATLKSVLVVDDNPDQRAMLKALLELEGYSVECAADAGEAKSAFRRRPARLVITDIFMPGGDGFELLDELSKCKPRPKIVVISGGPQERGSLYRSYLQGAELAGADAVLRKPIDSRALLDTLTVLEASALPPA